MGLLDDAIREHLDLKRRRGADPAEIERLEHEALGPVRRGPEEPDPIQFEHTADIDDDVYDDDEDWEEPVGEDGHEVHDPDYGPQPSDPRTGRHEPAADAPWPEDEAADERRSSAPLPPSAPGTPPPHPAGGATDVPTHLDQETAEHEFEPAEADDETSEDVLEETPEFLQDTPDHDRLWFEQRPPRDFDFDG